MKYEEFKQKLNTLDKLDFNKGVGLSDDGFTRYWILIKKEQNEYRWYATEPVTNGINNKPIARDFKGTCIAVRTQDTKEKTWKRKRKSLEEIFKNLKRQNDKLIEEAEPEAEEIPVEEIATVEDKAGDEGTLITITVSPIPFESKPSSGGDIKKIWSSIETVECTISELTELISNGGTIVQYTMNTKNQKHLDYSYFIFDIDNKDGDLVISPNSAMLHLEALFECKPMLYYPTFSDDGSLTRFRLIYGLAGAALDFKSHDDIYKYCCYHFPWLDKNCRGRKHLFFGTDKECVIVDADARISSDQIELIKELYKEKEELILEQEVKKHFTLEKGLDYPDIKEKYYLTAYGNAHIFDIINAGNGLAYRLMEEFYGNLTRFRHNNSNMYTCPVHGGDHGDNLKYYPDTDSFFCFSECGEDYNAYKLLAIHYQVATPLVVYVKACDDGYLQFDDRVVQEKQDITIPFKNRLRRGDGDSKEVMPSPGDNIAWAYTNLAGKPLPVVENLIVLLLHYNIRFELDTFSREVRKFDPNHILTLHKEGDLNSLLVSIDSLCVTNGLKLPDIKLKKFLDTIFIQNEVNPFLDFMIANENDDTQVIWDYFDSLIFDENQKEWIELYREYWLKWLLSIVHLQFNTVDSPKNAEFVLTLQGGQNAGKSYFGKNLMSPIARLYNDGVKFNLKYQTNETKRAIRSFAIVEIAELESTTGKNDQGDLKAFITASSDSFHELFVGAKTVPRRTSFFATVNGTEFLFDETGDRRYAVMFGVIGKDKEKADSVDIAKLWGAVYHLYVTKYSYLKDKNSVQLDPKFQELQYQSNMRGKYHTSTYELINELYDFSVNEAYWNIEKAKDIVKYVNDNYEGRDKATLASVKHAMATLGIEYKKYTKGGEQLKGYKVPPRGVPSPHFTAVRQQQAGRRDNF